MRACRNCGALFHAGTAAKKLYCSEACRREYQNKRRKDERKEEKEARCATQGIWPDPWQRNDLDAASLEAIYANALLDPLPIGAHEEAYALRQARAYQDGKAGAA